MTAAFEDDQFSNIPDEPHVVPDKPAVAAWNVVAKKKPAKPKEPAAPTTPVMQVACKFFKLGKCSAGKGCRFSHDPNAPSAPPTTATTATTSATSIPENGPTTKQSSSPPSGSSFPCKFHAAGYCRNGPKCPFMHSAPKKSTPVPTPVINKTVPLLNGTSSFYAPSTGATTTTTTTTTAPATTNTTVPTSNAVNVHPSLFSNSSPPKPNHNLIHSTSPSIPTSPLTNRTIGNDAPFPTARSPTATQHTNIMNIWPASSPVPMTSLHPTPFFSSSPSSSIPSPRHVSGVSIPSLASLPSSPSFLSSSPFSMFMSTKEEEEEEDDEDDELLPIPGLTIIDDTHDDFVFNPYDDILNTDDDFDIPTSTTANGKKHTVGANGTHFTTNSVPTANAKNTSKGSNHSNSPQPVDDPSAPRSFADIVKTNITVTKSIQLQEEEAKELYQQDDESNNKLCQFFMTGNCRYGTGCRYVHGNVCEVCQKPCLLPDNPQQNEDHAVSCLVHMRMLEERQASKDVDCGICYEKTVDKGRRFGLLSHCDHPFCLECIREWRGQTSAPTSTIRSCPICRVTSYYIIPSEGFVTEITRKSDIIEQYKSKLTTITCKYFNLGKGVCKFGTSCMYAHTNADGTPYVPPPPRKMQGSEGEVTFYNGLKLGAFLDDYV